MKKFTLLIVSLFLTVMTFPLSNVIAETQNYTVIEGFEDHRQWNAASARANSVSIEVQDSISRFGNHALEMRFDFEKQEGVSGVYAQPNEPIVIPGTPKKMGMWVYGDASAHWMRLQLKDANGEWFNLDMTGDNPNGVNWKGWTYLEAAIPATWKAPFKLENQAIRYMATKDDLKNSGTIYVDQVIALYDEISEDVTNPVIDRKHPEDRDIITNALPTFEILAHDESGLDVAASSIWIDEVRYPLTDNNGVLSHTMVTKLLDGKHTARVEIKDLAGNHTLDEWTFFVDTGSFSLAWGNQEDVIAGAKSSVSLRTKHARVGDKLHFDLESVNVKNVSFKENKEAVRVSHADASFDITILKETEDIGTFEFDVDAQAHGYSELRPVGMTFARGSDSGSIYMDAYRSKIIQPLNLSITGISVGTESTLKIVDLEGKPVVGASVNVLNSLPIIEFKHNASIFYSDSSATLGTLYRNVAQGSKFVVAKMPTEALPFYRIHLEDGSQRYYHVPKEDVVEHTWSTLLKPSDKEGIIKTKDITLSQIGVKLQAVKDHKVSQVLDVLVAPQLGADHGENMIFTWVDDVKSTLHVAWKTGTHIGSKPLYFKEVQGTTWHAVNSTVELMSDKTGEFVAHHVDVSNLKPNTHYLFAFEKDSDAVTYTTPHADEKSFSFVFASDSQATNREGFALYNEVLEKALALNPNAQFIMHGGDIVEEGNKLNQWDLFLEAHAKTGLPLVSVLGNHDVYGSGTQTFEHLLKNPQNGPEGFKNNVYYIDYAPMRMIVLNSEVGRAGMEAQLPWLEHVVSSNPHPWTVVSFHRSPYKANPKRTDDLTKELFAPKLEALGVDLVLTGHDHSYMRTKPIKNGEVNADGTTYIVGGSSGPKFYPGEPSALTEVIYARDIQLATNIQVWEDRIEIDAIDRNDVAIDHHVIRKEVEKDEGKPHEPNLPELPNENELPDKNDIETITKLPETGVSSSYLGFIIAGVLVLCGVILLFVKKNKK